MRKATAVLILLSFVACKKGSPPPGADAGATIAAAEPSAPGDAGTAPISVDEVDRYLEYRRTLTGTHKAIAPRLDAIEAKAKKSKDGGTAAEEGLKLIGEEAKAQAAAREKSGLTQARLDEIEAMVQELVTEREMAEDTASPEDLAEMEAMAKKMPADQKATIDQSIADLKAQRERAMQLTDMRERFGSANVDVLLQREQELRAVWTEWIKTLAGEAK